MSLFWEKQRERLTPSDEPVSVSVQTIVLNTWKEGRDGNENGEEGYLGLRGFEFSGDESAAD